MANPNPNESTRFPAKYKDVLEKSIPTVRIRVPEYLVERIEALAMELHQEELAKQKAELKKSA